MDNSLIEYKYNNTNLIKVNSKENAHSELIISLKEMDDEAIVSYSFYHSIKFWI